MPNLHDPLLDLLRSDPTPLLQLLRVTHPDLPLTGWTSSSEAFGRAKAPQRRPDLVLVHPVVRLVIVLELQLRRDDRKLRTWPYYASTAELRHGCDAVLLVITLSRSVARWARGPHAKAWGRVEPVVFGPDELPAPEGDPAMLVLAALARGRQDKTLVHRAVMALEDVDDDRATAYVELLQEHLPRMAPLILELMMNARRKRSGSLQSFIEEFSKMVGREEGREEGRGEGREEGETTARRQDVTKLLRHLRRDHEIEGLATLDLPALNDLFDQLLSDLQAPA